MAHSEQLDGEKWLGVLSLVRNYTPHFGIATVSDSWYFTNREVQSSEWNRPRQSVSLVDILKTAWDAYPYQGGQQTAWQLPILSLRDTCECLQADRQHPWRTQMGSELAQWSIWDKAPLLDLHLWFLLCYWMWFRSPQIQFFLKTFTNTSVLSMGIKIISNNTNIYWMLIIY